MSRAAAPGRVDWRGRSVRFPPMAFIDRERFKRFEQFFTRHLHAFVVAAQQGYRTKGRGVLIYSAPDDRFEGNVRELRFDYKSQGEIEAMNQGTRDELVQGMLERYEPPGEAVFVALYRDNTYDISRVVLKPPERGERPN